MGIFQLCFNYFEASFFKALGLHLSREAERDAREVSAFTPVALFA